VALAVALLGAYCPPGALAEELPLVQVTYSGSLAYKTKLHSSEGTTTEDVHFTWSATGASEGLEAPQALTFASLEGGSSAAGPQAGCTPDASVAIAPGHNPVAGDWSLEEVDNYPDPGWRYEIPVTASTLPDLWTLPNKCGEGPAAFTEERTMAASELFGYASACLPENPGYQQKYEELLAHVTFAPGEANSWSRELNIEKLHCAPIAETTFEIEQLTVRLTASVGSPPTGSGSTPPQEMKRSEPKPETRSEPPLKTPAGEARQKEKEEARARVFQETVWAAAAHGAKGSGGVLGVMGSLLAPLADNTLKQDVKTANDPPAPEYEVLAQPQPVKAGSVPPCGHGRACRNRRAAESALVGESAQADSLSDALYTTMSRETAAIDAGDASAAASQAVHLAALNAQLDGVFAAQAKDGKTLAGLLRIEHLQATISKARMKMAIDALEKQLMSGGVSASSLASLAGSALTPRKTNVLDVLARGEG
jgi:hypothetical protein